jgi:hypothetical protein
MRRFHFILISFFLIGLVGRHTHAAGLPPGAQAGASPATAHDFHVSITEIHYNPEARALEIAIKIFTDDLEAGLEGLGAPILRLGTPREDPSADSLLKRYLDNRFQISIEGKLLKNRFLGKEMESDATWCYIEIADVPRPATLTVHNRILLERFEDQANLVNLDVGGGKRSLMLRKGNEAETAEF